MVTVYWCATKDKSGMRATPPTKVMDLLVRNKKDLKNLEYLKCPAFKDAINNIVGISSYYSYNLRQTEQGILETNTWDQGFFDKKIIQRSNEDYLHSFLMEYIFFTEEPSLTAHITPSYLEENSFNSSAILIPGKLDIGKYFRNLECAFHIRKNTDTMKIKEGDIYMYLGLDTEDQIQFKEFLWTPKLQRYSEIVLGARENRCGGYKPLSYFYSLFRRVGLKSRIIKEIKNNLCEE